MVCVVSLVAPPPQLLLRLLDMYSLAQDLVVRKPIDRIPEKHFACLEATGYFVNPGIIKRHPLWSRVRTEVGRLEFRPKGSALAALVEGKGVRRRALLEAKHEKLKGFAQHTSFGLSVVGPVA